MSEDESPAKKTRLVVYLKTEQYERVDVVSKQLGVPYSSIVAQALHEWLSKDPVFRSLNDPEPAAKKRNGKSKEQET